MPFRTEYGVSRDLVERFVEENEVVREWVARFSGENVYASAYKLCRFFKWLKMERGVELSPKELLNEQIGLRSSQKIQDRCKHLHWVLQHTRDNPDFDDYSDNRKYGIFIVIKGFYDYHEVPLTTAKNVFGRRNRRKKNRKQITLAQAKRIMGLLPQRESMILLIILQSGMEIGAVLNKFNFMWDEVVAEIEAGRPRVKVEFNDRKSNNFPYFTYISRDSIQELKKWLMIRERIVAEKGEPQSRPIFITNDGTPYLPNNYFQRLHYYRTKKNLPNFVTHQFRKLFKTEASIPERGIDRNVVEFWMGHVSGIAGMGGVYDKTPEIHEDVIEREYMKLEPYINIYSSSVVTQRTDPLLADIEQISRLPGGREFFTDIVEDAKAKLADMLQKQRS